MILPENALTSAKKQQTAVLKWPAIIKKTSVVWNRDNGYSNCYRVSFVPEDFLPVSLVSEFTKKVLTQIKSVPRGKVATYKQIAELSGKPQGSRGVSWILHSCSTRYKLPWHRILNSKGTISFERSSHNYRKQKRLLEAEGIVFSEGDKLNLKKYQWAKRMRKKRAEKSRPRIFSKI